jgi:hypothetical protein
MIMSRYIFRRKAKINKLWSFSLLAMVFVVPAFVLEHVDAEQPQPIVVNVKQSSDKR